MQLNGCLFIDPEDRIEFAPEKDYPDSYIAALRLGFLTVLFRKGDEDKLKKAIAEAYQYLCIESCAESDETCIPMPQA